jgi:hypothetical protein
MDLEKEMSVEESQPKPPLKEKSMTTKKKHTDKPVPEHWYGEKNYKRGF